MNKYVTLLAVVGLSIISQTHVNATEYIFRDLMANTLPSPKCDDKNLAMASATKAYTVNRYSKKFCQTQGYGWHLENIKDQGNPICEVCSADGSKYRCHLEDVVVQCKRIRPGSVGMLPGKS